MKRQTVFNIIAMVLLGFSVSGGATITVQINTTFAAPDGTRVYGAYLSDTGWVAGYSFGNGQGVGFLRAPDGTMTNITYPGATGTRPFGINSAGEIAGIYNDPRIGQAGFIRNADRTFIDLAPFATAYGPNDSGAVVGDYHDGYFRSSDGTITPISYPGAFVTIPEVISDSGNILGVVCFAPCGPNNNKWFIRYPDGSFAILPVPSYPVGMDAAGDIFGSNYILKANGQLEALAVPGGGSLWDANDQGQVSGSLYNGRGFIGTITPEPGTLALIGTGFGLVGVIRRKLNL